jgi:hypothetical protein
MKVHIIPTFISITGNFHTRTLVEIAQLIAFKENLPDAYTYKKPPKHAQKIAMTLHVRVQEWLTLLSKVSRSILNQSRKIPTHATHNNKDK